DDDPLRFAARELLPALEPLSGTRRDFGFLWNDAEPLLVGEDGVAKFVPTVVEQVHIADLLDPLRRRVVRRMHAARNVVDEERLGWIDRGDAIHVFNRIVCHYGNQVPAWLANVRIDRRGVAEQVRLPLVGVAAGKAV